jgi:predicted ATP-grasp superfamily ATP-dependent carboligase
MYTGGLENQPGLIDRIAALRPLWGNAGDALRRARSPQFVTALLDGAGLACPRCALLASSDRRWVVKPRAGSGGIGIRFASGDPPAKEGSPIYYQEYIEGDPVAAVYVAEGRVIRLLGVSRQLVGEASLHASRFHYCGSVGPLVLSSETRQTFERIGSVLAEGCPLRGLFGVDCILCDGVPWPVEVNPRYTASVEVLEYATGINFLSWHWRAFEEGPEPAPPLASAALVGKAIYFAPAALTFPGVGPWNETHVSRSAGAPPAFADIPEPAQPVAAGRPVLTFFVRAQTVAGCLEALRQTARDLDRCLIGR